MAEENAAATPKVPRKLGVATVGGAIVSALAASVCCIGPLVAAGLGVGGAGFMLKFAPYRPYFIAATVVLLGVGFFLAYRHGGAKDDCGCERPPAKRMGRIGLWIATVVVALFIASPYVLPGGADAGAVVAQTSGAKTRTVTLGITGMTCAGCASGVKAALTRLRGVQHVSVSYKHRRAVIRYRPKLVRPDALIKAIEKLGYTAKVQS